MTIEKFVPVTITLQTTPLDRAGFGTALIAGYHTNFAARTKLYAAASALADMETDGFDAEGPFIKAATALLAQTPRPPQFKVGRFSNSPTQSHRLTIEAAEEGVTYTVEINGTPFSYTAAALDDEAAIALALETAINAGGEPVTADDTAGGGVLDLTADVAGELYEILAFTDNEPEATISQDNTTADPGVTADLNAIIAADSDWYALMPVSQSKAELESLADIIATQDKIMVATVADTALQATPDTVPPSTEIGDVLFAKASPHTALIADRAEQDYASAAWLGRMLPTDPGSATWAHQRLSSVIGRDWSAAEQANMEAKNANYYLAVSGVAVTFPGQMSGGEFIDTIRGSHWLKARTAERIFGALFRLDKIPFTDDGIALVVSLLRAQLNEGVDQGYLSPDAFDADNDILDPFVITFPRAADVGVNDKANRLLPDIVAQAKLAGAIHTVPISITLSL